MSAAFEKAKPLRDESFRGFLPVMGSCSGTSYVLQSVILHMDMHADFAYA